MDAAARRARPYVRTQRRLRLKTSWVCDIDWPVVGHAACGLVGEFDEYNDDPNLKPGNPASGYWVRRGRNGGAGATRQRRTVRLALPDGRITGQSGKQLGRGRPLDR